MRKLNQWFTSIKKWMFALNLKTRNARNPKWRPPVSSPLFLNNYKTVEAIVMKFGSFVCVYEPINFSNFRKNRFTHKRVIKIFSYFSDILAFNFSIKNGCIKFDEIWYVTLCLWDIKTLQFSEKSVHAQMHECVFFIFFFT